MELHYEIVNGTQVLALADRLDEDDVARFAPEVRAWSDRLLGMGTRELVVDFGGVTLVSSAVLRCVLTTAKRVRRHGGLLSLVNPSPDIADAWRTSGFLDLFEREGMVTELGAGAVPPSGSQPRTQLDLLLGAERLPCADGDTVGTVGSLRPELFAGVPGLAERHVTFHWTELGWILTVAEEASLKTKLDKLSLVPGQSCALEGEHLLQVGALWLRLQVGLASAAAASNENPDGETEDYAKLISAMADSVVKLVCGTSGETAASEKPEGRIQKVGQGEASRGGGTAKREPPLAAGPA